MIRLVILNDSYYNEYIKKKQEVPNDSAPLNEIGVFYSSNSKECIIKVLNDCIIEMISLQFTEFKHKIIFISQTDFNKENFSDIKEKIAENLRMNYYSTAIDAFKVMFESVDDPLEKSKSKEYLAITYFLRDYYEKKENIEFNKEIESLFKIALSGYKKLKENYLLCENLIRLATYYAYFKSHFDDFLLAIRRVYENSQELPTYQKLDLFIKISWILREKKFYRKENLNYYLVAIACINLKEKYQFFLPVLFNYLMKQFCIYDIEKEKILNKDIFDYVHRKYIRSTWKKIECNVIDNKDIKEHTKKKLDKGARISIKFHIEKIKQYILLNKWDLIQQSVYLLIINYFKDISLSSREISLALSYIQSLNTFISKKEEQNILNSFISNSLTQQSKINISLVKFPLLVRLVPRCSPIKFDIVKNSIRKKDQLFLYNPWEKSESYNFYWTENSHQIISIQFHNPLKTEITLGKIIILFKTERNTKAPLSYPSTISIPSESSVFITVKIKPISIGVISIIGIQYEIVNAITEQYVDSNGNGLFYSYNNFIKDPTASQTILQPKKRVILSLNNIRIYPEIPYIELKILDDSINSIDDSITLYEHQLYNFSFMIENKGNYPINKIKCSVYAYKKEDYKVNLKEINAKAEDENTSLISPGKKYHINYLYYHQRVNLKIEFRLYYISNLWNKQSENDECLLKPFLLYLKSLNTENLITLSNVKLIPKVTSTCIGEIIKVDTRLSRRYQYKYSTNKHILSLTATNNKQNKMKIVIESNKGQKFLEDKIKNGFSKELSFDVSLDVDLLSLIFNWEFTTTSNIKGTIKFSEILSNLSDINKRSCDIEFKIESTVNDDYTDLIFIAINHTGKEIKKPRMYIYFYQYNEENGFTYNSLIQNDSLFYTGTLTYNVGKNIKDGEKIANEIKVYSKDSNENIRASFVFVDKENEIVYLSPYDINVIC